MSLLINGFFAQFLSMFSLPCYRVPSGCSTGVDPADRTGVVIFSHASILNENPH